jgi:hypothetical protein
MYKVEFNKSTGTLTVTGNGVTLSLASVAEVDYTVDDTAAGAGGTSSEATDGAQAAQ